MREAVLHYARFELYAKYRPLITYIAVFENKYESAVFG